jgi:hypothetical protein
MTITIELTTLAGKLDTLNSHLSNIYTYMTYLEAHLLYIRSHLNDMKGYINTMAGHLNVTGEGGGSLAHFTASIAGANVSSYSLFSGLFAAEPLETIDSTLQGMKSNLATIYARLAAADHTIAGDISTPLKEGDDSITDMVGVVADRLAANGTTLSATIADELGTDTGAVIDEMALIKARLAAADHTIAGDIKAGLTGDTATVTSVLTTLLGRLAGSDKNVAEEVKTAVDALQTYIGGIATRIGGEGTTVQAELDRIADAAEAQGGESGMLATVQAIAGSLAPPDVTPVAQSLEELGNIYNMLNPAAAGSALNPDVDSRLKQIAEGIETIPLITADVQVGRYGEAVLSLMHLDQGL